MLETVRLVATACLAAVVIALAAFVVAACLRARRRRRLLDLFLYAVQDGQARFRYHRQVSIYGEKEFRDTYDGRAGLIPFSLETRIRCWAKIRPYSLVVTFKRPGRADVTETWWIEASPDNAHPIVRAHDVLRRAHARRSGYLLEAS